MTLLSILAATTTGLAATGALLVGGTDQAEPSAAGQPAVPCGAVWDRLPGDLQDDLLALRGLPAGERADAAREVRRDALAGEYGARVQRFADNGPERRAAIVRHLPQELRADVRAAMAEQPGDRADAFAVIRDRALAGDYGTTVQDFAQRAQERRDECRPGDSA